jgi:hypothetical protein
VGSKRGSKWWSKLGRKEDKRTIPVATAQQQHLNKIRASIGLQSAAFLPISVSKVGIEFFHMGP